MVLVSVPGPRARVEAEGGSLRVRMPPRRSALRMLFLAIWLAFWWLGETDVLRQIQSPLVEAKAFLMLWLAVWTMGGFLAFVALLWMALGAETLELGPEALSHRRTVLGLGPTRSYDLRHVANLRTAPAWDAPFPRQSVAGALEFWGLSGGAITFDYGPITVRVGAALEEPEAAQVIGRLTERNPRLRARSNPASS